MMRKLLAIAGNVIDLDDFIRGADDDPYFAPFAGGELLPSSFYFMQLSQLTAIILSVSLTYLDGYERVWWRFVLNLVAILGLVSLLLTTKPYRKIESFSMHVQSSLLLVSYMVTLTRLTGTLSSPQPSGILLSNMNSTANDTFIGQASAALNSSLDTTSSRSVNITSPFALTEAANLHLLMQQMTVVLSYATLVVVGFIVTFVAISFFGVLKLGAELERKLTSRSLALKVERALSAGRSVIHSLKSVLQKQKRGVVEKKAEPPEISSGIAKVAKNPSITKAPRLTMRKALSHAASSARGTVGVISTISHQGSVRGETRVMSFSPVQPRKSASFQKPPETLSQALPSNPESQVLAVDIVSGAINPLFRRIAIPPSTAKKERISS
jgi:hypothetical protein